MCYCASFLKKRIQCIYTLFFLVLSDGRNKSMRGFDKRANITIAKYMFVYLIINCNIDYVCILTIKLA